MRVLWLAFAALIFLALLFFAFSFFGLHIKPTTIDIVSNVLTATSTPPPQYLSILIGILTLAELYDRRHFLRLVYALQPPPEAVIDVKFAFCRLTKPEQRAFVTLEIFRFDDVIILNCSVNMNEGKTHAFFASLPTALPRRYDYVMKADDDAFVRPAALAAALRPLPQRDMYYGRMVPCAGGDPFAGYMSGMGFVLSWDLVDWIATSEIAEGDRVGPEDKLVGRWLGKGGRGKNRVTEKTAMYDYPGTNGRCSHELIPGTVLVHRLKRWERWVHVLRFFNLTRGLKPSKLYFIDQDAEN